MTVYSELLRMALEADDDSSDRSVDELVASLLIARREVLDTKKDGPDTPRAEVPLVNSLAYDKVLVQLCRRVGIEESLTDPAAGQAERRSTEERLANRIPELTGILWLNRSAI